MRQRRYSQPTTRDRGFTLLEVLVALAIVVLGMAALLSALSSAADSTIYLRDKTFAEWVALNRIEEVRLALQRPQKGESEGEMELAGRKWQWKQEVLETEVSGILRIDVRVRPSDIKGDSDTNWYTTLSGISGDALATPSGVIPYYDKPSQTGGGPGPGRPGPGNSPRPGLNPNPGTPNPNPNPDPGGTPGGEPGDPPATPPSQPPSR
jgi:general secretion pathway protein I